MAVEAGDEVVVDLGAADLALDAGVLALGEQGGAELDAVWKEMQDSQMVSYWQSMTLGRVQ